MEVNFISTATRPPSVQKVLQSYEIEEVHGAALQVLDEVGVMFESKDALRILEDSGAEVVENVVHIPEELTKECLRKAPPSISLYDVDGNLRCTLEGAEVYFNPGSTAKAGI